MNIGSEKINPSEAGSSRSQSHSQVSRSESLWSRVRAPAPVSCLFLFRWFVRRVGTQLSSFFLPVAGILARERSMKT